ncbi:hypothetical protein [uncultured Methanobrevibacter sp.]|uniref:hypothetical protein n=1 Tax=uncultured Methanobrevibacter sp. TaxID=253161 RepID=UPI002606B686|nr:hypothetical protein [uncultured Methanobrevibacter sp.]
MSFYAPLKYNDIIFGFFIYYSLLILDSHGGGAYFMWTFFVLILIIRQGINIGKKEKMYVINYNLDVFIVTNSFYLTIILNKKRGFFESHINM